MFGLRNHDLVHFSHHARGVLVPVGDTDQNVGLARAIEGFAACTPFVMAVKLNRLIKAQAGGRFGGFPPARWADIFPKRARNPE